MFKQTIKLNKDLMARVQKCSQAAGYSSVEEFVQHVLEREVAKLEQQSTKDITKALKGLGYLD